jgi:hypothetical protein
MPSTSGNRFVRNGPEASTDMVTLLPVVARVWYREVQFGALGAFDTVRVAYYCATQSRSFSEMCIYARRSVPCYKEH